MIFPEPYLVEKEIDTPSISLENNGEFAIEGKSYPEDTLAVYQPVISWIKEYVQQPNDKTTIQFSLDYFNSSSYKAFLTILLELEKLQSAGKSIEVVWHYRSKDEDLREGGEEFQALVNLPFSYLVKD